MFKKLWEWKKMKMRNLIKGIIFGVMLLTFMSLAIAEPTGTTITSNSTNPGRSSTPANRSDAGGSITTLALNAVQQDQQWKAYIGNISGTLTLDDTAGNTIYKWSLSASEVTGEIFASRSNAVTWSNINCSVPAIVTSEETTLGITSNATDSINRTFNTSTHSTLVVAGKSITQNTCSATSTYVNSLSQAQATADFPEVLLDDDTNLIYATIINQDKTGYTGSATYDFQMIVADTPTVASTMYYFYAEIGS